MSTNEMRFVAALAVLLTSLSSITLSVADPAPGTSSDSTLVPARSLPWAPDKNQMSKLGPELSIGDYSVRIPTGWLNSLSSKNAPPGLPPGLTMEWYTSPRRPDGTSCVLGVNIVELQPGDNPNVGLLQRVNEVIAPYRRAWEDFQSTPMEFGVLGGFSFARIYFSGTTVTKQGVICKSHGFTYVTIDNGRYIFLSSHDIEPYEADSLALTEASVMTFKHPPKANVAVPIYYAGPQKNRTLDRSQ
jgi:hypothetical protein